MLQVQHRASQHLKAPARGCALTRRSCCHWGKPTGSRLRLLCGNKCAGTEPHTCPQSIRAAARHCTARHHGVSFRELPRPIVRDRLLTTTTSLRRAFILMSVPPLLATVPTKKQLREGSPSTAAMQRALCCTFARACIVFVEGAFFFLAKRRGGQP